MADARLGESMTHIEELIGKGKEPAVDGGSGDRRGSALCRRRRRDHPPPACRILEKELKRVPKLWDLFVKIEMPLVTVLADMEMAGIALDKDFFSNFRWN